VDWEKDFEAAFSQLKREFKHKTKRSFLDDVRAEIEENDGLQEILSKQRNHYREVGQEPTPDVECGTPVAQ